MNLEVCLCFKSATFSDQRRIIMPKQSECLVGNYAGRLLWGTKAKRYLGYWTTYSRERMLT